MEDVTSSVHDYVRARLLEPAFRDAYAEAMRREAEKTEIDPVLGPPGDPPSFYAQLQTILDERGLSRYR